MKVSAILLAAGRSTRMGRNKLLMPWEGSTVIRSVAERLVASPAQEVVVVLGHESDEVRKALAGLQIAFAANPDFSRGMGTSLSAGAQAAAPGAEAFLIALGDMPKVTPQLLVAVLERAAPDRIVVPRSGGREGNPVVFGSEFRSEIQALRGDHGARSIIDAHRDQVTHVDWAEPADFDDIDTPKDL